MSAAWIVCPESPKGIRGNLISGSPAIIWDYDDGVAEHSKEPLASGNYLDRLMRRASFEALWPLFAQATRPAKEMTESFSALEHLRPFFPSGQPFRVIHVGDGAHARTGALFALKTRAENISVDPLLNEPLVQRWCERFSIERLSRLRAGILDVADQLNALPPLPVFVTFVHAHVAVDRVLARLRWNYAFTLVCCLPGHQLSSEHSVVDAGNDAQVLSAGRGYQVLRCSADPSRS